MWPFDAAPSADPTDAGSWAGPSQAANVPASVPGDNGWGGGMFTPGSLLSSPDFRRHAAYDALTNAGMALIGASAPSPYPQNLGSMFGALAGGAAQGVQGSAERYMKMAQLGAQLRSMHLRDQMYPAMIKALNTPVVAPADEPQVGGAAVPPPPAPGGTAPATPDLQTAGQPMVDYLAKKYGLSPVAAGAVVGNLYQESKFDPTAKGDGGKSVGMAQWDPGRYAGLTKFAETQGKSPTDPQTQLDYIMTEMKGGDMGAQRAYAQLQTAKTPGEATTAMMHFFRPAGYTPANPTAGHAYGNRLMYSTALAQGYQPSAPTSASSPTSASLPAFQGAGLPEIAQGDNLQPAPGQPPDQQTPPIQLAQAGPQPDQSQQPPVIPSVRLPPPPKLIPVPPGLGMMAGDPVMGPIAKAKIAEINRANAQIMEKYKANVDVLKFGQTQAVEQQKLGQSASQFGQTRAQQEAHFQQQQALEKQKADLAKAQAAVDPQGNVQQAPITAAAAKAAAVKSAQMEAEQKGIYPEEFKGKSGQPLLDEIQKQRPNWGTVIDDLHSGRMAISDISQRMQTMGIDPSRVDFVALTRQAYPDWNMRLGEQRKTFEGQIFNQQEFLGKQRAAIDLVYKHLDQYGNLMQAVTKDGYNSPMANNIVNAYRTQTGDPRVTNAQALQHILSSEIATAVRGGSLAEADIQAQLGTLDTAHNWDQSKGTLDTVYKAIKAREGTMMNTAETLGIGKKTRESYIGEESRAAQEHFANTLSLKENKSAPTATAGDKYEYRTNPDTGKPQRRLKAGAP